MCALCGYVFDLSRDIIHGFYAGRLMGTHGGPWKPMETHGDCYSSNGVLAHLLVGSWPWIVLYIPLEWVSGVGGGGSGVGGGGGGVGRGTQI